MVQQTAAKMVAWKAEWMAVLKALKKVDWMVWRL